MGCVLEEAAKAHQWCFMSTVCPRVRLYARSGSKGYYFDMFSHFWWRKKRTQFFVAFFSLPWNDSSSWRWIDSWANWAPVHFTPLWKFMARSIARVILHSLQKCSLLGYHSHIYLRMAGFCVSLLRVAFGRINSLSQRACELARFSELREEWSYGFAEKGSGVFCCSPKDPCYRQAEESW